MIVLSRSYYVKYMYNCLDTGIGVSFIKIFTLGNCILWGYNFNLYVLWA